MKLYEENNSDEANPNGYSLNSRKNGIASLRYTPLAMTGFPTKKDPGYSRSFFSVLQNCFFLKN